MKKSLIALSFIALASIIVFGGACRRTPPKVPTSNTVTPPASETTQISNDTMEEADLTEVGEPAILAILLLTQDAEVTVSRGDEQTDAVNQMELYAGDEVSVIKSEAQLLYPDVGISILPEGTRLTIMPGEGAENGGFSSQILLEAGKIWTRLEHVLGSDESFSVEASDVVATVRGTAFGVSMINGEIDISVAGNQVAVSTRNAIKSLKDQAQHAVMVAAGNAIKVNPSLLISGQNPRAELLKKLRKVSDTEKKDLYYRFGTQRLDMAKLKKPDQTFKWSAPINVNNKLQERLTPEQIQRLKAIQAKQIQIRPELLKDEATLRELMIKSVRFQIPLREVLLHEMTTTDTPSANGPTN
jgi:hypothetical protein